MTGGKARLITGTFSCLLLTLLLPRYLSSASIQQPKVTARTCEHDVVQCAHRVLHDCLQRRNLHDLSVQQKSIAFSNCFAEHLNHPFSRPFVPPLSLSPLPPLALHPPSLTLTSTAPLLGPSFSYA